MIKYGHYYSNPFFIPAKNKQYQQFLYQQNACCLTFKFDIDFRLDCREKSLLLHYQHLKYIESVLQAFSLLLEILYKIQPNGHPDCDILYHEELG